MVHWIYLSLIAIILAVYTIHVRKLRRAAERLNTLAVFARYRADALGRELWNRSNPDFPVPSNSETGGTFIS